MEKGYTFMYCDMSNEEFRRRAQEILAQRRDGIDYNFANTHLNPGLVDCDIASKSLTVDFKTLPWMRNPMGVVHGGMIGVMVDNAMGFTCGCLYGAPPPTISMNVQYARPVPLNEMVHVRTQAIMTGGTTAQLTAQVYLPSDPERVLVFATGTYYTKLAGKK